MMSVAYGIMAAISVLLLAGYWLLVRQREFWLLLLYLCVSVVNFGYFLLSLSKSLDFALMANKLAYLGSVFLSMCMFMTIVNLCGFRYQKRLPLLLLGLGLVMFGIICTTGILPWYYKDVSLTFVDGAAKLEKTYGVLHPTYLIYLLAYFAAMITCIILSHRRRARVLCREFTENKEKDKKMRRTVIAGNCIKPCTAPSSPFSPWSTGKATSTGICFTPSCSKRSRPCPQTGEIAAGQLSGWVSHLSPGSKE